MELPRPLQRPWRPPGPRVRPDLDVHLVELDVLPIAAFVRRAVADHLKRPVPLTTLHEHVGGDGCDALGELLCAVALRSAALQRFVDGWCRSLALPETMQVQERLNVRVMPPAGAHALDWHADAALGHAKRQWTLWVPVAGVAASNTIAFRGKRGDLAVVPPPGHALVFSAHQVHRTWRREATATRVSLDLRVLEARAIDQAASHVTWRPRFRRQGALPATRTAPRGG